MTQPPGENLLRKFRILVAPLDWGLGHTTRCIPVIREFLAQNCEVIVAGNRHQQELLKAEFPNLSFLPLKGYEIQYSKKKIVLKLISQVPKIILRIRHEHSWLKKTAVAHHIDAVISDNRFGLYHEKIPTVFITHQLHIKTRLGKWSENILSTWNYRYIRRFTECWVPDSDQQNSLAGMLSHPGILPTISLKYIGLLSRFYSQQLPQSSKVQKGHLLFMLSGPEPQRTLFEDKIINDVSHYAGTATIVRGLPSSLTTIPSTRMIKIYNHLPSNELKEEMDRADWVISRSGYSTVMDLVALQKKAILVPTPGQPEQEYIAEHLRRKHIAFTVTQKNFSLGKILDEVKGFEDHGTTYPRQDTLKIAIQNFILRLETHQSDLQ